MNARSSGALFSLAMAAIVVATTATAAVIPADQITATASSENANEPASKTIDGSGLVLDSSGPPNAYLHEDATGDVRNIWQTAVLWEEVEGVVKPKTVGTTLTLTFAQNYDLDAFHVWQIRGTPWRGIDQVRITTSDGGANAIDRGLFTLLSGDNPSVLHGQRFDLAEPWTNVKSVTLTVETVLEPGQFHVGLGEIQFHGAPTPEPTGAGALFLVGGLGALGRWRRGQVVRS